MKFWLHLQFAVSGIVISWGVDVYFTDYTYNI